MLNTQRKRATAIHNTAVATIAAAIVSVVAVGLLSDASQAFTTHPSSALHWVRRGSWTSHVRYTQHTTSTTSTTSTTHSRDFHSPLINSRTMGIAASIFQDQADPKIDQQGDQPAGESQEVAEAALTRRNKSRKQKRRENKEHVEKWKIAVEDFKSKLIDDSFLQLPVRASTVNASLLYPSDYPDHPGLMPGNHKHLGGAFDATDGCIYGVPAHARSIMCIHPSEDTGEYRLKVIPLPEHIQEQQFKWLRGIIADGYLWAIPSWADAVLCVDLDAYWGRRELPEGQTDVVNLIPLPEEHPKNLKWQWHGASMNQEKTAIFCIPANARKVLRVDMATKTTSLIDINYDPETYPEFTLDVPNKWYGGIPGDDNAVYGVPYRACGVLRIDCATNSAKIIGPDYKVGKYYWHGGIKVNGKIYAHPSHASTVLVIDTSKEAKGTLSELEIHKAEYDKDERQNYKWLGGTVGADGNIYCPACDTSAVLKINVTTDHCETFSFAGHEKNKWQGGVLGRDNCIYCIPADGTHVCRIATDPSIEGENPVQLLGDLPKSKDKWQGAAVGKDGALYFIPEGGYRVMRVVPPEQPPKIVDGKLPEDDVLIQLM